MAWREKLFISLSVSALMHLYCLCLLDDSAVNRPWLCWLRSWWSSWPSCDTGCCRCPEGQAVCPQWCVGLSAPPSGEPCGCGWCSFHTRRWNSLTGRSQWLSYFKGNCYFDKQLLACIQTAQLYSCMITLTETLKHLLIPQEETWLIAFQTY